jgi:hypothetical protein
LISREREEREGVAFTEIHLAVELYHEEFYMPRGDTIYECMLTTSL